MTSLARIDVTLEELRELVRLARARHMELERMLMNVEETEGLDATKFRVRKELQRQIEVAEDLLVKLEAALKEASR